MDLKVIRNLPDIDLREKINLEKFTTIKLGNTGSVAIVKTIDALKSLVLKLIENKINFHLVGWGANQILLNSSDTLFIKLDFELDKSIFKQVQSKYELPASTPLNILTSHAQKFGLKGWEVFTGIPASLGGAIFMNAGTALGEIGDLVEKVVILRPNGEIREHICNSDSFSYRQNNFVMENEIIISAILKHNGVDEKISLKIKEYLEYRKTTQPLTTKNCGSVFKNISPEFRAGQTIDAIGLKEFGFDNLIVSKKHANFVENLGGASAEDFKLLVDCLKIDIERFSGHKFELEAKVY